MQGFLTFIVCFCIFMALLFGMENDFNNNRVACLNKGGEYVRIAGGMHCVNKDLFININR